MNKSTAIKKKAGRPKYTPTQEVRNKVEAMTTAGLREEVMARILDISRNTLREYYATELETGRDKVLTGNTVALVKASRNGNVTAMIYLQKCLGGSEWKEKQEIKHEMTTPADYDQVKAKFDLLVERKAKELAGH